MSGGPIDDAGPVSGPFLRHRALWIASDCEDRAHLAALATALERALERDPDSATDVAARALGICLLARGRRPDPTTLDIGFTGLDAAQADLGGIASEREALLAACVAELHAQDGRRLDALGMLRRARRALDDGAGSGPPAAYAALLVTAVEGALAESAADRMGAARAFAACAAHAATLLDAGAGADSALDAVLAGDVPARLAGSVRRDAMHARVAALLGRARALVPAIGGGAGTRAAEAAARAAFEAIGSHGMVPAVEPLDLVETVVALPPAEAARLARTALRWIDGASRGPARDWEAVVYAARAHGAALRGDAEAAAALYERAGAVADDDVTPLVAAFVRGLDLLDNGDAEEELRDAIADEFLIALSDLANAEYGAAARPDARAGVLLEAPIAAAISNVASAFDGPDARDARVRLGLLVDILREPRWQPVIPELHTDPGEPLAVAGRAWELALDRPGRILHALRTQPSTAVLVTQRLSGRTLFVGLRADGSGTHIDVAQARPEYRAAVRALTAPGAGEAEGRHAFELLPEAARTLLSAHARVIVVPDPRVRDGTVAFRRMQAGDHVLDTTRTFVHMPSLRAAMRALEPADDDVARMIDAFTDPDGGSGDRLARVEKVRTALAAEEDDPRAEAALAFALAMTWLDGSEPGQAEWAVERLIAAADELGHARAGALLRTVRTRALARRNADDGLRLEAVEEALPWIEAMREAGESWERLYGELSDERDALALRVRILEESARFPGS